MTRPMPNYRFIFKAAAVMLCFAGLARAQSTRPAGAFPDGAFPDGARAEPPGLRRVQERMSQLGLTDDQKVQFQAIKDEIAETVRGMGPELKNLSPDERREKVKSALGDVREKMMSILTPEQKKKLREAGPLAQPVPGGVNAGPATRPAVTAGPETPMIDRVRQAVIALGLTPEQKTQVDAIFEDASTQAAQIRKDAINGGVNGDRKTLRDKVQDLTTATREKLAAVLTPEQRAKLKETAPAGPGGRGAGLGLGGRKRAGKTDAPATRPATGDANPMNDGGMDGGRANPKNAGSNTPDTTAAKAAAVSSQAKTASPATQPVAAKVAANPAVKIAIGSPAPAFVATRLSGTEATNKSFTGKPLVLAFGSLTSPSFRDRLAKLEAVKKRYTGRANVVVVYTKEAHPADGWQVERNRDDKIEINAPTTMKDRLALAAKLKDMSKTSLDIVVDGMDDATLAAFGGSVEGAVVLTPLGTVLGTQTFCDPSGLPRMIDDALKAKN